MPMPDEAEVTLNGLPINQGRDANGVLVTCSKITGWGPAAVTGGVQQKSGMHGGSNPRQWYQPLTLTVTGMVQAPTRALAERAKHDFNARVALDLFPLIVTETIPVQVLARANGAVDWDDDTDSQWLYSIELICPDPFKYGTSARSMTLSLPATSGGMRFPARFPLRFTGSTVSGDGEATNAGNHPTVPTIRLAGPLVNPAITSQEQGRTVTYRDTIAAGEFVDVDMANWSALLNGVASRSGKLVGSAWSLQPGDNTVSFRAQSGSGTAQFQWRDTYR